MFFDMHTDILYDIVQKRRDHKRHIIKDDHLKKLLKGEFIGGIWTYYTDIWHPLCEFNQAIDLILEEFEDAKEYLHIVTKKDDFKENKLNVIAGFESLQPVKSIAELQSLYKLGFRHAMLTWNEENQFATGVKGNPNRGLTDLGKEVIHFMNQNHMIIDVSHANIKTFNDIIHLSNAPLIASHSNVYELCPAIRNLNINQIKALTDRGGFIGTTAVKGFINPQDGTIKEMIKHIDYLKSLGLTKQIGFGFDFMDYLGSKNLEDLQSASDTPVLKQSLLDHGYLPGEIEDISYRNALKIINQIL